MGINIVFAIVLILGATLLFVTGDDQTTTPGGPTTTPEPPVTWFECPDQYSYHVHPENCTQYLICVFGKAYLRACEGGLNWNNQLKICDWPNPKTTCQQVDANTAYRPEFSPVVTAPSVNTQNNQGGWEDGSDKYRGSDGYSSFKPDDDAAKSQLSRFAGKNVVYFDTPKQDSGESNDLFGDQAASKSQSQTFPQQQAYEAPKNSDSDTGPPPSFASSFPSSNAQNFQRQKPADLKDSGNSLKNAPTKNMEQVLPAGQMRNPANQQVKSAAVPLRMSSWDTGNDDFPQQSSFSTQEVNQQQPSSQNRNENPDRSSSRDNSPPPMTPKRSNIPPPQASAASSNAGNPPPWAALLLQKRNLQRGNAAPPMAAPPRIPQRNNDDDILDQPIRESANTPRETMMQQRKFVPAPSRLASATQAPPPQQFTRGTPSPPQPRPPQLQNSDDQKGRPPNTEHSRLNTDSNQNMRPSSGQNRNPQPERRPNVGKPVSGPGPQSPLKFPQPQGYKLDTDSNGVSNNQPSQSGAFSGKPRWSERNSQNFLDSATANNHDDDDDRSSNRGPSQRNQNGGQHERSSQTFSAANSRSQDIAQGSSNSRNNQVPMEERTAIAKANLMRFRQSESSGSGRNSNQASRIQAQQNSADNDDSEAAPSQLPFKPNRNRAPVAPRISNNRYSPQSFTKSDDDQSDHGSDQQSDDGPEQAHSNQNDRFPPQQQQNIRRTAPKFNPQMSSKQFSQSSWDRDDDSQTESSRPSGKGQTNQMQQKYPEYSDHSDSDDSGHDSYGSAAPPAHENSGQQNYRSRGDSDDQWQAPSPSSLQQQRQGGTPSRSSVELSGDRHESRHESSDFRDSAPSNQYEHRIQQFYAGI